MLLAACCVLRAACYSSTQLTTHRLPLATDQLQRYLHAARHLSACHLGDEISGLGRFGFRLFEVSVVK